MEDAADFQPVVVTEAGLYAGPNYGGDSFQPEVITEKEFATVGSKSFNIDELPEGTRYETPRPYFTIGRGFKKRKIHFTPQKEPKTIEEIDAVLMGDQIARAKEKAQKSKPNMRKLSLRARGEK